MVSADKLFTFGQNAVLSTFLYASLKELAPTVTTRALQWTAGGVVASTLFQAYYPDYHVQMRQTCGENFTKAVSWLYPGVILLAGYIGGLPREINLFASSMFFMCQHILSNVTFDMANNRLASASQLLCTDAEKAVKAGLLQDAGKKLEEVEILLQQRTDSGTRTYRDWESDSCKHELSQAFLKLSTPKVADAEKWALAIHGGTKKLMALEHVIYHLLKTNGEETKVLELLEKCKALVQSTSAELIVLQFEIAVQYKKSELLDEVKEFVANMVGNERDSSRLLALINKAIEKESPEIAKLALKKAKELADHLEINDLDFWGWHSLRQPNGIFSSQLPINKQTYGSEILYHLVVDAVKLEEWSEAKELLKHDKLTYQHRVAAQLELAHALGQDGQKSEMQQQLKQTADFILAYEFPKDMEERAVNETHFRQKWLTALLSIQLEFDLDGAFETIEKLPQGHEEKFLSLANASLDRKKDLAKKALAKVTPLFGKLSSGEQEDYAKIQAILDPEILFASCGDPSKLSAVVKDESSRTRVLLTLTEARLKRQEYDQADALFKLITQDASWVRRKVEQLRAWPRVPALRFGFI